jgi:ketosteroid isomerase-like protein
VTPEARSARVVQAVKATVSGDTSAVTDLFTEDVVALAPSVSVSSLVELAVELEDLEDAFSDVVVRPGPVVSDGDRVCAEWVVSAVHCAPVELAHGFRMSPTDRRVTLRGVTVADFDGDRICAIRHYWDQLEPLSDLESLPDR